MEAEIANRLKSWALEEGFDRAGIAGLEPSEYGEKFRAWVERGDHAGMEWIARREEIRLQPGAMLEGARSALCVALQYHPLAGERDEHGDLWGGVARYAWGLDYHDVMIRGLKRLEQRIVEALPGVGTRRYVDTGPVLEKELAARAGLGAMGKNTLLLHPEAGSHFLLGEIFLTIDLPAEEPIADLCGSCSLCLEACPTGALADGFRLDSRLCLSYWTIEHRGSFPAEISARSDEWVFGCDACQQVCPWNDSVEHADHLELLLPDLRRDLDLIGLLALERSSWVELFRGSPIKRAKLEGMQRNVAAVLGHRGAPGDLEALIAALGSDYASVRVEAVRALGRLEGGATRRPLEARWEVEPEEPVRDEIERVLALC